MKAEGVYFYTPQHLFQGGNSVAGDLFDEPPAEQPLAQKLLVMEQWGHAQFPVARDQSGDIYMPMRALCLYLGIASQMQIKTLRKSRSMSRYMRRFISAHPVAAGVRRS